MRIAVCQRWLKHYRIPVYERLAARAELTVFAAPGPQARRIFDHTPPGFRLAPAPISMLPAGFVRQPIQAAAAGSGDFDVVVLPWDIHYAPAVWPAFKAARQRGTRVVLWGHGYSRRSGGGAAARVRDALRNRMGRRADGVLLYTETIARQLIDTAGFDEQRVFVAQNALDQAPIEQAIASWTARPDALRSFQAEHGLDPRHTILFVSRLLPSNRAELLVDALAAYRKQQPTARLVIIGDGAGDAAIDEAVARHDLAAAVCRPGAIYDEAAIAPWMLSAGLMCYPRNIGLSILQAFGYGLPVVTGDRIETQNPEIEALDHGVNGLVYDECNVDAMVAAWQAILESPEKHESMRDAARRTVAETYTLDRMVQGFVDLEQLVDRSPA